MNAVTVPAASRDPRDWIEDTRWHRHMFGQSSFRWVPEDPIGIALKWTRGRLSYETPGHLRLLDDQIIALRDFASGIDDAMAKPLKDAHQRCTPPDYRDGLDLVGLTSRDVSVLRRAAIGTDPSTVHPEARRVLYGLPWPNPFTEVWELRQMRGMYTAAENLLEDLFCDLVLELAPSQGWDHLARLCRFHFTTRSLEVRVEAQRTARGDVGDPRRVPAQRYGA